MLNFYWTLTKFERPFTFKLKRKWYKNMFLVQFISKSFYVSGDVAEMEDLDMTKRLSEDSDKIVFA